VTIFIVGLVLFVVGTVLNALGWRLHYSQIQAVPEEYLKWLLGVIRDWFGLLTRAESTSGQRLAAFGAILTAIGLVTTVAGLLVWAV
jgi:hypothetical protein